MRKVVAWLAWLLGSPMLPNKAISISLGTKRRYVKPKPAAYERCKRLLHVFGQTIVSEQVGLLTAGLDNLTAGAWQFQGTILQVPRGVTLSKEKTRLQSSQLPSS